MAADEMKEMTASFASLPISTPENNAGTKKPKNLMDLPAEIRNHIWHYATVSDWDIVSINARSHCRNLARVSRQVRDETLPIYFSDSTFSLGFHKADGYRNVSVWHLDDELKYLEEKEGLLVSKINNTTIILSVDVKRFPSPTSWYEPKFFRLNLHDTPRNGLQVSLETVPGYHGGEPVECCVCEIEDLTAALGECGEGAVRAAFYLSTVFPGWMVKQDGKACGECGKKELCWFDLRRIRDLEWWWVTVARFLKLMREMGREMKA